VVFILDLKQQMVIEYEFVDVRCHLIYRTLYELLNIL